VKLNLRISHEQKCGISRRDFMAAAAALTIVPSGVLGRSGNVPPSNKLNIAGVGVGVGGMGGGYIQSVSSENIVALCDVDEKYAANTYKRYPRAKIYRDFRKMLEKEKNIDAVVIGTPDHTHAVIASMAMKMGKHVYCAKPLTRTIGHYKEWIEACKGGKPAGCNFDIGGPLTEMTLLGNIAIRTGKKLNWDGENMKFTNVPEANDYLHYEYRDGWTL